MSSICRVSAATCSRSRAWLCARASCRLRCRASRLPCTADWASPLSVDLSTETTKSTSPARTGSPSLTRRSTTVPTAGEGSRSRPRSGTITPSTWALRVYSPCNRNNPVAMAVQATSPVSSASGTGRTSWMPPSHERLWCSTDSVRKSPLIAQRRTAPGRAGCDSPGPVRQ